MHVLYFLKRFPKLSESFVLNEIDELTRRGHDVSVFAQEDPDEAIRHDEHEDLDVSVHYAERTTVADAPKLLAREVCNSRVLRQCFYYDRPKEHAKSLDLARRCIKFIDNLDQPIDHIHGHFASRDKIAATYAAAYHGVPCTVTAHAYELFADPDPHALEVVFDRIDRVIVPSQYNRSYLRKRFGVREPIDVVPATTRVSKFEPTGGAVPGRILTVARLVEKKGIIYAIEALAQLVKSYPNLEYHIVGSGQKEDALRRRAAELGVGDHVAFLGHVDDERLHREYNEAVTFVLPCVVAADGDRDAMPVVLKEAMAMETACVSTTISAVPELIENGTNGLLVEPRDVDALAEAIGTLIDDESTRREMRHNARKTLREKFSLDVTVDTLLASFRKANTRK